MNDTNRLNELCGFADLYVLGSLSLVERAEFKEHLLACAECQAEVERSANDIADLCLASTLVPGKEVRSRLASALDANSKTAEDAVLLNEPGIMALKGEAIPWKKTPIGGLWIKTLAVDATRKYATSMVKMEAGSRYPSHRHTEIEEVFVLKGDLTLHNVTLRTGDYCRAQGGTQHGESSTEEGCTLLVVTSQLDEITA